MPSELDQSPTHRAGGSGGSGVLGDWVAILAADGLLYATRARGTLATVREVSERYSDPQAVLVTRWAIAGQLAGLEWCLCDGCGTPRLTKPSARGPLCTLTPGCVGRLRRVAARPILTAALRQALLFPRDEPA